jgi:hypothetical protein
MKAVIVYESMYGNTHSIADAVATGLRATIEDVAVVSATDADSTLARGADLLVVGGPTHARGLSRASTRKAALEAADKPGSELTMDAVADGPGIREWLASVADLGVPAAAFDTRFDGPPVLTGRASRGLARKLRRLGCSLIADPESFLVTKQTQLKPGEEDRAREWGSSLAVRLSPTAASPGSPSR